MTPLPNILVAGIGNIFLGDDAFGCAVTQRLLRRGSGEHVRVVDFGIRGLDLVYALQDGYDAVILVDAVARGEGAPGTLYLLEPEVEAVSEGALIDPHSLDPVKVLRTAAALGAKLGRVFLVGCEPATRPDQFDEGEMPVGMSAAVEAAVEQAAEMVDSLVERLGGGGQGSHTKEASACRL
jgi:hydrogenase maturation protease